jgi:hypothetical protein
MRRPKRDPVREDRIYSEAIVDARPEEQAMSWYYYLEGKLTFPFRAWCVAANVVSPLQKDETIQVLRMATEDACEHDMFVQIRWQRAEVSGSSFPTGSNQPGRIHQGSHRRLALLGGTGLLSLIYARLPKAHAACTSRRPGSPPNSYDTSVMLLRCDRCPWNIRKVLDGLDRGLWDYCQVMCAGGRAAWLCGSGVLELDPAWNTFDALTGSTRLLHYTTREHQPWKNDALPSGRSREVWEHEVQEASHDMPILCQLVRDGVGAGLLKPGLLSLIR